MKCLGSKTYEIFYLQKFKMKPLKIEFSKPEHKTTSSSEELFIEQYLNESGISYHKEVLVEH